MPLEEGSQNALQLRGVDLPGELLRSDSGGVLCQINIVGSEDSNIVSVGCTFIFPFEVVAVGLFHIQMRISFPFLIGKD